MKLATFCIFLFASTIVQAASDDFDLAILENDLAVADKADEGLVNAGDLTTDDLHLVDQESEKNVPYAKQIIEESSSDTEEPEEPEDYQGDMPLMKEADQVLQDEDDEL